MSQKNVKRDMFRKSTLVHFKSMANDVLKKNTSYNSSKPGTPKVNSLQIDGTEEKSEIESKKSIFKSNKIEIKHDEKLFVDKLKLTPTNSKTKFLSVNKRRATASADMLTNKSLNTGSGLNILKSIDREVINKEDMSRKTIQLKVAARFRPFNKVESELSKTVELQKTYQIISDKTISFNKTHDNFFFTFDKVFDTDSTQTEVYQEIGKETIEEVLKGYNGTIFAYGQSGSGKTHTMYGADIHDDFLKGIVPRSVNHIFDYIEEEKNKDIKFEIKFSLLEIYKEQLYDLLNPDIDGDHTNASKLKIKEKTGRGVYIEGLTEEYISELDEFFEILEQAEKYRVVSETYLNKASSRSHMLLKFEISQKFQDGIEKKGILNLVDLAGSEKVSKTGAQGETLEEAKKINLSLSALGMVISNLSVNNSDGFVPYRDSKLTRILQDSLGGNFKTTLIVTCSPHFYNCEETLSTLNFAQRAKKIKTTVGINVKRSPEELEKIIRQLNEEITKLKSDMLNIGNSEKDNLNKRNFMSPTSFNKNYKSDDDSIISDDGTRTIIHNNENDESIYMTNNNIMKAKDEEIKFLKEEILELKNEIKILRQKLEAYNKEQAEAKLLSDLENLVKFHLDELKKLKLMDQKTFDENLVSEGGLGERVTLRRVSNSENYQYNYFYNNLNNEDFQYANSDLFFQDENVYDTSKKFKRFKNTFKDVFKNFSAISKDNNNFTNSNINLENGGNLDNYFDYNQNFTQQNLDLYKSRIESFISSYQDIFLNSKLFMNKIFDDILSKKNFFSDKDVLKKEDTNYNYNNLKFSNKIKSSYMNLSVLNITYEKIISNFFNKFLIDFRKFYNSEFIKNEQSNRIDSMCYLMENYMELLQYVKSLKYTEESRNNPSIIVKDKDSIAGIFSKPYSTQRNIIKPVKKRSSFIILNAQKKFNLIQNNAQVPSMFAVNNGGGVGSNIPIASPIPQSLRINSPDRQQLNNLASLGINVGSFALNSNNTTTNDNKFQKNKSLEKSCISSEDDSDLESKNSHRIVYNQKEPIQSMNFRRDITITENTQEDDEDLIPENKKYTTSALRKLTLQKKSGLNEVSTISENNSMLQDNNGARISHLNNFTNKNRETLNIPNQKEIYENGDQSMGANAPGTFPTRNEKLHINMTTLSHHHSLSKENGRTNLVYNGYGQDDNTIILIKRELNLHKNYTDILRKEISKLKAVNIELEMSLREYKCNYPSQTEIDSFSQCILVFKSFYEDEIKIKNKKIELLTNTIDEILLNKGALSNNLTLENFSLLKTYFENKKNNILNENDLIKIDIQNIAQSYISESGSATRKMDYIHFHRDYNSRNGLKVDFGTGLHSKYPGVSPLVRNLKQTLKGDDDSFEMENSKEEYEP